MLGLVVVFGIIAAQPPSLLSIVLLIVSMFVVLQFPRWLMAGLSQLPAITPQTIWSRGTQYYLAGRSAIRDIRAARGVGGVVRRAVTR